MSCVILVLMKNMVSSHLVWCRNLTITDETVFFFLFLLIVQYVLYSYTFGYTVNSDKNLIIVPKEADIVRKIFDLYNSGLSMATVAEKVNQMGVTTRQGKPFTRYSVRDILHNEKYTGTYIFRYNKDKAPVKSDQYNGEVRVPGGCPQIISLEVFEKAKHRRNGGTDETAHSA